MHLELNQLGLPTFEPLPFLNGPWAQTIAGHYWPQLPDVRPTDLYTVHLDDGDCLSIAENKPAMWQPGGRILVLIHGLCGSHSSNYMSRICRTALKKNLLVIRVNLRGCGSGFGLARMPYHSGRSEDIRQVLKWLEARYPTSPVTQIGFSLGANITLKMIGEDGSQPSGNLDSAIAISPPIDLAATARHLCSPRNRLFDRFFVRELVRDIKRHHAHFRDLPAPHFHRNLTVNTIDEVYTAPRSGFRDAADYYAQASSSQFIPEIRVPTLLLCAKDDPIVDARALADISLPDNVELLVTTNGGHVGFLGQTGQALNYRWMDKVLLHWLARL